MARNFWECLHLLLTILIVLQQFQAALPNNHMIPEINKPTKPRNPILQNLNPVSYCALDISRSIIRQKSNIHPSLWNTKRNAVELPSHHPPEALSTIIFPHPLMISMPKVVAVFQVALADLLWASVCGFWKGGQPTDGLSFTQWVITSNSVAICQTDSTCIAHRQQIITTDSVLIRWISV